MKPYIVILQPKYCRGLITFNIEQKHLLAKTFSPATSSQRITDKKGKDFSVNCRQVK
jgi:hypothetical protein